MQIKFLMVFSDPLEQENFRSNGFFSTFPKDLAVSTKLSSEKIYK